MLVLGATRPCHATPHTHTRHTARTFFPVFHQIRKKEDNNGAIAIMRIHKKQPESSEVRECARARAGAGADSLIAIAKTREREETWGRSPRVEARQISDQQKKKETSRTKQANEGGSRISGSDMGAGGDRSSPVSHATGYTGAAATTSQKPGGRLESG